MLIHHRTGQHTPGHVRGLKITRGLRITRGLKAASGRNAASVLAVLILFSSCLTPPEYFPQAFSTAEEAANARPLVPAARRDHGSRYDLERTVVLQVQVYAPADITAPGFLRMGLLDPESLEFVSGWTIPERAFQTESETESQQDTAGDLPAGAGIRVFEGWIPVLLEDMPFTLQNSAGLFARAIDGDAVATYRTLSSNPEAYWQIVDSRYAYREVVRHWGEDVTPEGAPPLDVEVSNESGDPLSVVVEYRHEHQYNAQEWRAGTPRTALLPEGSRLIRPTALHVLPQEQSLPVTDRMALTFRSDYTAAARRRFTYTELANGVTIREALARNRELSLRVGYDPDGSAVPTLSRTLRIASVQRNDFVDQGVARAYYEELSAGASRTDAVPGISIDEYHFGAIHVDEQSEPEENRVEDVTASLTYRLRGPVVELYGDIAELERTPAAGIDPAELAPDYTSFVTARVGGSYLIRTTEGGVLLVVIDRITPAGAPR